MTRKLWWSASILVCPSMAQAFCGTYLGPAGDGTFPHVLIVGPDLKVCNADVAANDPAIRAAAEDCH